MTDAERLEWACGVLNREGHRGCKRWTADYPFVFGVASDYERLPHAIEWVEAFAIALALDEQMRRRLAPVDRAEWASLQLSRLGHHEKLWAVSVRSGGTVVVAQDGEALPWPDALAIAESLVRRELLEGDTK